MEFHTDKGGDKRGKREARLEVLNKSSIVLITAFWEAYCEDLAAEALEHLVANVSDTAALPKELRKGIARSVNEEKNELEMWKLANDGWKDYLKARLEKLTDDRNWDFKTPKSEPVGKFFSDALGIEDITTAWRWEKMSSIQAREKLDGYISLRGEIAHRGGGAGILKKSAVTDYLNHITRLVGKTGGRVNAVMKEVTGKPLWEKDEE